MMSLLSSLSDQETEKLGFRHIFRRVLFAAQFIAIQTFLVSLEAGSNATSLKPGYFFLSTLFVGFALAAELGASRRSGLVRVVSGFGCGVLLVLSQLASFRIFGELIGWSGPWSLIAFMIGGVTPLALTRLPRQGQNATEFLTGIVLAVSGLVLVNSATTNIVGLSIFSHQVDLLIGLIFAAALFSTAFADLRRARATSTVKPEGKVERFRALAEALPIPIVLTTADNEEIIFANERSRQRFFVPPAQQGERSRTDGFYTNVASRRRLAELIAREGAVEGQEVEMRASDGANFWALIASRAMVFDGELAILTGYFDITDRKAAEEALLASEVRYALISRASNDGIWDWDMPSGRVYYSSRWKEIVGAEPNKRLSTLDDWLNRVHPEDLPGLKRAMDEHLEGLTPQLDTEYRLRHGDGRYCWMQCRGIVLRNNGGVPIRMAGSQADVTLRKSYENNLRNAAYEDRLTGISNRAFFTQLVDSHNDEEQITDTAIVLLNIDQFRRVNDNLGTGAGDALLIALTRRLAAHVTPEDALARLGGDEFAIWLNNMPDEDSVMRFTNNLRNALLTPFELGDGEITISLSAGIALPLLGGATSGADLLHNARIALDRAKSQPGGNWALFDDVLFRETKLRQRLSRDLVSAGRFGQIYFDYQPVMKLHKGGPETISGFEALMRWRHPELGVIPPNQFIPLAEEGGLIGELGILAIEHAAREIKLWTEKGLYLDSMSVAVNLSPRQIADPASVQRLYAVLDRVALPPGYLKLEITESLLMSDPDAMITVCHQLRHRGVELSLDDFGTGFSSLSYLHRFPFNVLKIDRSFVNRMLIAPEALRLVRSIIELSHDLGFSVVAEGVEEVEQADRLRDLGCDYAQGFLFSRPLAVDKAEALLRQTSLLRAS